MTLLPTLVASALVAGSVLGGSPLVARGSAEAQPAAGQASVVPAPAADGVWPLVPDPPVERPFDPPEVQWGSGHRGVDLRGRVGQAVRATLPGTVTYAGRIAGRGVVVVDHGHVRTTYEPVAASVGVGDEVGRGGTLGTLELFGSHCLPAACLHWGARDGEEYLDPLTIVGRTPRPVRLLPVE